MLSGREFLNTIILLGALQGFIVAALLFFSAKLKQANRLLAALIFLIALASLNLYLNNEHLMDRSRAFLLISTFIPLVIVMPFGPLIFLYVKSCLDPEFEITKKFRPHFYPVIIDLVPQFTAIIYVVGLVLGVVKRNGHAWGNFIDTYNIYADIPRWVSISIYLWLSARYLSAVKSKHKVFANAQMGNLKWLQQFIYVFLGFQCIWLLYLVPYVIPKYTDILLNSVDWYPIYIPLAIIVYWLGIKGLLIDCYPASQIKKAGMNNSSLSQTSIDQIVFSLMKSMKEDKLYLRPALNLSMLTEHTGISQKNISAVLNQHLDKSFNEFVNEFRVNAFKEKMQRPEMDNLTMAGIAQECGFNSQATFQRTFKQVTGCSPSEFRKTLLEFQ
jgi:AraC-like DNA-binding protein